MKYRNVLTGYEFETESQVSAPNWERVGADPAPKKDPEPVKANEIPESEPAPIKEETKKPITKKKPAKKGAKK